MGHAVGPRTMLERVHHAILELSAVEPFVERGQYPRPSGNHWPRPTEWHETTHRLSRLYKALQEDDTSSPTPQKSSKTVFVYGRSRRRRGRTPDRRARRYETKTRRIHNRCLGKVPLPKGRELPAFNRSDYEVCLRLFADQREGTPNRWYHDPVRW